MSAPALRCGCSRCDYLTLFPAVAVPSQGNMTVQTQAKFTLESVLQASVERQQVTNVLLKAGKSWGFKQRKLLEAKAKLYVAHALQALEELLNDLKSCRAI
eukprot:3602764-Pleurochrysis_carterae.AAC.3